MPKQNTLNQQTFLNGNRWKPSNCLRYFSFYWKRKEKMTNQINNTKDECSCRTVKLSSHKFVITNHQERWNYSTSKWLFLNIKGTQLITNRRHQQPKTNKCCQCSSDKTNKYLDTTYVLLTSACICESTKMAKELSNL